jgi:hypothetical protein
MTYALQATALRVPLSHHAGLQFVLFWLWLFSPVAAAAGVVVAPRR